MKTYRLKLLYTIIIISAISVSRVSAQVNNADTTKLLASVSKNEVANKTVIEASNVEFPESLEDYRDQSIDYVEKFSSKKRDYLLHTYEAGKKYFPKIVTVLKRYNLPEELKVLVALESGFCANAVSKAGAVGYWQIMDQVAREYGLQISSANNDLKKVNKKDERMNFTKSTLAAAKYLHDQKLNLNNDLLLMVAAYNCGIGSVRNAIRKSRKTNPDFWDIKKFLPRETINYVMNFIALNVIFKNYENFSNRQLLFAPKIISIPFETPGYNSAASAETPNTD